MATKSMGPIAWKVPLLLFWPIWLMASLVPRSLAINPNESTIPPTTEEAAAQTEGLGLELPKSDQSEGQNRTNSTILLEEGESWRWPPNPDEFLRELSREQKKEILLLIGRKNESQAQIEGEVREVLANNSIQEAFDQWLQKVRKWRYQRFLAISANLSSQAAKELLDRIWAVLNDTGLGLVESCRRVNRLLAREEEEKQGCEGLLAKAEVALESGEEVGGHLGENGGGAEAGNWTRLRGGSWEEEGKEEAGTEIFDGNEFNELHHEPEPGSREEH